MRMSQCFFSAFFKRLNRASISLRNWTKGLSVQSLLAWMEGAREAGRELGRKEGRKEGRNQRLAQGRSLEGPKWDQVVDGSEGCHGLSGSRHPINRSLLKKSYDLRDLRDTLRGILHPWLAARLLLWNLMMAGMRKGLRRGMVAVSTFRTASCLVSVACRSRHGFSIRTFVRIFV